jgi:hypothetical protein
MKHKIQLKVKEIVLTHPIDEGKEPWPEDEVVVTETIENEIEEFRLLFNNWVRTFDKGTNLSDGWELPLNS